MRYPIREYQNAQRQRAVFAFRTEPSTQNKNGVTKGVKATFLTFSFISEARQWYLAQEASIPGSIDTSLSLEQQAFQSFKLRNNFRTQARNLMSDRVLAESLAKTDPNLSWEQVVQKQINKGLSGDDVWKSIIESSQRSRQSVNENLGIK